MFGPAISLISTVTASDEVAWRFYKIAGALFLLALLCAAVSLTLLLLSGRGSVGLWIAIFGTLAAVYPFIFSWYLYDIDFVAVGRDGTKASPPFWQALAFPAAMLVVPMLLAARHCRK